MSKKDKEPEIDPATKDAWDYLIDVIGDYESFLEKVGDLGLSAPQLLYYRDEVQEFLEELTENEQVNYQGAYKKVLDLDEILREKSQELVNEIGHDNFLQYQIINDPPKAHWWWWLNRVTSPPPPPPKVWQFWKHQALSKDEDPGPQGVPKDKDIAELLGLGETEDEETGEGTDPN